MKEMTTCLWFDTEAEDAANFWVSVFPNSKITNIQKYPEAGQEITHKEPGSVMTVEFELNGAKFLNLNGGPHPEMKFSPGTSFMIPCEDQAELDRFWEALSAVPEAEACGWCTDKFGVTWQVFPTRLTELLADPSKTEKVTAAFMQMKKFDIAALEAAAGS
ncbi:MAG: VOC family protein [Dehalococcoidia bacterium]